MPSSPYLVDESALLCVSEYILEAEVWQTDIDYELKVSIPALWRKEG